MSHPSGFDESWTDCIGSLAGLLGRIQPREYETTPACMASPRTRRPVSPASMSKLTVSLYHIGPGQMPTYSRLAMAGPEVCAISTQIRARAEPGRNPKIVLSGPEVASTEPVAAKPMVDLLNYVDVIAHPSHRTKVCNHIPNTKPFKCQLQHHPSTIREIKTSPPHNRTNIYGGHSDPNQSAFPSYPFPRTGPPEPATLTKSTAIVANASIPASLLNDLSNVSNSV
jgi:hypothetical protein